MKYYIGTTNNVYNFFEQLDALLVDKCGYSVGRQNWTTDSYEWKITYTAPGGSYFLYFWPDGSYSALGAWGTRRAWSNSLFKDSLTAIRDAQRFRIFYNESGVIFVGDNNGWAGNHFFTLPITIQNPDILNEKFNRVASGWFSSEERYFMYPDGDSYALEAVEQGNFLNNAINNAKANGKFAPIFNINLFYKMSDNKYRYIGYLPDIYSFAPGAVSDQQIINYNGKKLFINKYNSDYSRRGNIAVDITDA